jgi:trigger factor
MSLLERNDVQVPQAMVQDEIGRLAEQSGLPADKEGREGDSEGFKARNALFDQEARRRVTLGLIMSRIVAVNDMKLDNARLNAQLENIASTFDDSTEVIRLYKQNQQLMEGVRGMALEDQVTDWLLEKAEVIDKPCSFDEVMNPSDASAPGGLVDVASKE